MFTLSENKQNLGLCFPVRGNGSRVLLAVPRVPGNYGSDPLAAEGECVRMSVDRAGAPSTDLSETPALPSGCSSPSAGPAPAAAGTQRPLLHALCPGLVKGSSNFCIYFVTSPTVSKQQSFVLPQLWRLKIPNRGSGGRVLSGWQMATFFMFSHRLPSVCAWVLTSSKRTPVIA